MDFYRDMQILGDLNNSLARYKSLIDPETLFTEIKDPAERAKKIRGYGSLHPLMSPEDKIALNKMREQQRIVYLKLNLPVPPEAPMASIEPTVPEDEVTMPEETWAQKNARLQEAKNRQLGMDPYAPGLNLDIANWFMNEFDPYSGIMQIGDLLTGRPITPR